MSPKPKTGRALLLSILFHGCLGIVAILAASQGLKMALPEGNVEAVTIETVESLPPETPAPPKAAAKPIVLPKAKMRAAPLPVAPPEVTQEESPVTEPQEEPQTESQKESPPEPQAESQAEPQTESQTEEAPEKVTEATEEAPAQGEAPGQEAASSPAFGTPGSTVNADSLREKPGNRPVKYPMMANLRRQEGKVTIGAYIEKDGSVTRAFIYKSSGFPLLDNAALETFSTWKYEAHPTWTFKTFNFHLTNKN